MVVCVVFFFEWYDDHRDLHRVDRRQRQMCIRDRRRRKITFRDALRVLETAAAHHSGSIVKSALMVGHGEEPAEVRATLRDLLAAGCEAVAIGQYLRPTPKQRRVTAFVPPEQFKEYEVLAYQLGFKFAIAGPFVRSSYRSEELLQHLNPVRTDT